MFLKKRFTKTFYFHLYGVGQQQQQPKNPITKQENPSFLTYYINLFFQASHGFL